MTSLNASMGEDEAEAELLSALSHELRTPLTSMLAWTHLLKSGKVPAHEHRDALERIERNAETLASAVEIFLRAFKR